MATLDQGHDEDDDGNDASLYIEPPSWLNSTTASTLTISAPLNTNSISCTSGGFLSQCGFCGSYPCRCGPSQWNPPVVVPTLQDVMDRLDALEQLVRMLVIEQIKKDPFGELDCPESDA
jgi:hypothetical protein